MTDHRQSAGRWNESELRNNPPRVPRVPEYQRRGQLPWTLAAIAIIAIAGFAYWILTL